MKRVFTSMDPLMAEQMCTALESVGIRCAIEHRELRSLAGPVPFLECWPEVCVLDDAQTGEAETLVRQTALDVRMMDRFFDNYIMTPMQKIVSDSIRAAAHRDRHGVAEARGTIDTAYRWLDDAMTGREWAAGDTFSLADCAAAPALFYADWAHPIGQAFANVHAYRRRLLARPSFARAVDEARPYRPLFPLGAPDRD